MSIENIARFVRDLFIRYSTNEFVFHNLRHTEFVVEKATEIAGHFRLNNAEYFIVQASAWFHDTGQLFNSAATHEEGSVSMMKDYLNGKIGESLISSIENCILSTKLPQTPKNSLEEILCDADLYHLGTDKFLTTNDLVRKEMELREGKQIDSEAWLKQSLSFLQNHKYHTSFCRKRLNEGKEANIQVLHKLLA